jgi:nitrogen fixation/metabolism regulation signal transduction histidine kinase
MAFKNFRLQVILRVILLVITIALTTWCLLYHYYLRSIYAGAAVILLTVEFIWYIDRFNRDVRSYLVSLQQHDFTTHFQSTGRSKSFDALYHTLNKISEAFRTISAEKEIQHRFLELLVEHLRVGIFTMDETGKIVMANQALKNLLQKDVIFSLKSLDSYDSTLVDTLKEIRSGETKLLKLRVYNEFLQLSIHASEFRLDDKNLKLISMQDIRNELDAKEMEAWQKLIRVLTHEIMNSVSPIISLSETMHGLVQRNDDISGTAHSDLNATLGKGLDAINARSKGLYNFTQSYRKLTGIPKVTLKDTTTRQIILRVATLMENKIDERGITLRTSNIDHPITVDSDLMEQVLINLVLNAVDAVADTTDPLIEIGSKRNVKGEVLIFVRDNGEGIDEPTGEKIFIPFFTTRKTGSGIGLALAKQILQLHHADISFFSERGKGTEFVIRL